MVDGRALEPKRIVEHLNDLPGWRFEGDSLQRDYRFTSFERVIAFMVECMPSISMNDHHPEWTNVFDKLFVSYRTHDAGNVVTSKDIHMAKIFEEIYKRGYEGR